MRNGVVLVGCADAAGASLCAELGETLAAMGVDALAVAVDSCCGGAEVAAATAAATMRAPPLHVLRALDGEHLAACHAALYDAATERALRIGAVLVDARALRQPGDDDAQHTLNIMLAAAALLPLVGSGCRLLVLLEGSGAVRARAPVHAAVEALAGALQDDALGSAHLLRSSPEHSAQSVAARATLLAMQAMAGCAPRALYSDVPAPRLGGAGVRAHALAQFAPRAARLC